MGLHEPQHLKTSLKISGAKRGDAPRSVYGGARMRDKLKLVRRAGLAVAATLLCPLSQANAQPPNIIFIMGDDTGWANVGVYNQVIMAGRTPNLDQLASQGMRFTDYYAEASCTAGRANFITGEIPIRTGLTTVGQAGSPIG